MGKKIAVFCSASYTIDPAYNTAARDFVRKAAAKDHTIVSGGTVKGTMGEIAAELADCGGRHIGIIPRFMHELVPAGLSEIVWTDTMAERKTLMREGSDAVVALPGGIGTLDEFIETLTLRKLDRWPGELYVLNIGGFYDPFKALLEYYVKTEMLDEGTFSLIGWASTVDELIEMLG